MANCQLIVTAVTLRFGVLGAGTAALRKEQLNHAEAESAVMLTPQSNHDEQVLSTTLQHLVGTGSIAYAANITSLQNRTAMDFDALPRPALEWHTTTTTGTLRS